MPDPLDLASLLLALVLAGIAGTTEIVTARVRLKIPFATLTMLFLVLAMFAVLRAEPDWLPFLARRRALLEHGEVWRAITALFAQDAGTAGAIFNLTILLAIGTVAEQHFGRRRWLAVYLGAGVLTEFLGLAWQPDGSGNSIAVFGLAGALAARPGRSPSTVPAVLRIVAMAAGAGLLLSRDIHGIGFWTGALIGTVLAAQDGPAPRLAARTAPGLAE